MGVTTRCDEMTRKRCVDKGLELALQRMRPHRELTQCLDGEAAVASSDNDDTDTGQSEPVRGRNSDRRALGEARLSASHLLG